MGDVNSRYVSNTYFLLGFYYTYCSNFWSIVLFIFITALLFGNPTLPIIHTVLKKCGSYCWFLLLCCSSYYTYILFSKTRPVTIISTGLIIGTQEYCIAAVLFKQHAYLAPAHFKRGFFQSPWSLLFYIKNILLPHNLQLWQTKNSLH